MNLRELDEEIIEVQDDQIKLYKSLVETLKNEIRLKDRVIEIQKEQIALYELRLILREGLL